MSQYGSLVVRSAHSAEWRPSVGGYSRGLQFVRDASEMLEGYNTVRSMASSVARIAPGHAPLVLKRYPAQSDGLEDIARLGAKSLN